MDVIYLTAGLVAGLLTLVIGVGVAIITYERPHEIAASSPMGNYRGYQVYCLVKPTTVVRRTSTRSLQMYCLDAFYVYTSIDPANPKRCTRYRADGDAWVYSWGIQFDRTGTTSLGRCTGVT